MALSEGDRSAAESGGLLKLGEALVAPALIVPRAIAATIDQVVVAWEAVRAIPEIRDSLASIMTDTRTMTEEVTSMRAGVDKLDDTVDILGSQLEEVGKVVRPLKRIGDRLRAPAGTGPVPDIEDAVADAATE